MAKYCSNCGRKLEEGEVCTCKDVVLKTDSIDFSEMFNKLLNLIKGIFVKPVRTLKEFKAESNFSLAVILIVVVSIILGLFSVLVIKNIYGATLNSYSPYLVQTISIPYFKVFIMTTLFSTMSFFVSALILYLTVNGIFKAKISYKEAFNTISALSIFTLSATLISLIGVLISVYVSVVLFVLAAILNLICLTLTLKENFELNDMKTMYSIILYIVFTLIVSYIIILIFN